MAIDTSTWKSCRDGRYGFVLRYPPDWHSTTEEGRCVQLRKGTSALPHGVPEVDVFIQVTPRQADFPGGYLQDRRYSVQGESESSRGVAYSARREFTVNGLPAVRARFESFGPTRNWGIEYAVALGNIVIDVYMSQPSPAIEAQLDMVMATLQRLDSD